MLTRTQKRFLVVLTMVSLVNGVDVIKMLSPCSCSVNGTIYNLKPLARKNKPAVTVRDSRAPFIKWFYSQCEPFTVGNCKDAAICGLDKTNKTMYRSPQSGMKCKVTPDGSVEFVYPGSLSESLDNTPGRILLKCDPKAKESTLKVLDDDKDVVLQLTGPSCECGNGCLDNTPLKPNPDHTFPTWAIVLIVVGFIVLGGVIGLCIYCKRRKGFNEQANLHPERYGAIDQQPRVDRRDGGGDGAENNQARQAMEHSDRHVNPDENVPLNA